jgi:hypothetical protein
MNLNNIDKWENISFSLVGTCDSLIQALADNNAEDLEDHEPFLHYLDNQIFRCTCCGWWSPISEMADNDNWECRDCAPDEEE